MDKVCDSVINLINKEAGVSEEFKKTFPRLNNVNEKSALTCPKVSTSLNILSNIKHNEVTYTSRLENENKQLKQEIKELKDQLKDDNDLLEAYQDLKTENEKLKKGAKND